MSAIIWGIAFVWLGIAIYIAAPMLVGASLPDEWRQRVADHYFGISMLVLDRAILLSRTHGGYSLFPSSYDESMEGELVKSGDEKFYFEDPYELMSQLQKRRFGVAAEDSNVIVNPRLAELGEHLFDHFHENHHAILDDTGAVKQFTSILTVPERPRMVNLLEAKWVFGGAGTPKIVETALDYVEISQEDYKTRNYVDLMIGVMAFAIVFGLIVLAEWVVGSGGGGVPGIEIGIFMGWF